MVLYVEKYLYCGVKMLMLYAECNLSIYRLGNQSVFILGLKTMGVFEIEHERDIKPLSKLMAPRKGCGTSVLEKSLVFLM